LQSLDKQGEDRERLAHAHLIRKDAASLFLWLIVSKGFCDPVFIP
jgi:hypothetical protein